MLLRMLRTLGLRRWWKMGMMMGAPQRFELEWRWVLWMAFPKVSQRVSRKEQETGQRTVKGTDDETKYIVLQGRRISPVPPLR